ncbi:MAG: type II toxin-antitoxin system VapC family toxin [Proteobacteria bacterium]|nr:type II toxin-antitoxin system VapC family toxin [Pseudomonadota bacterium]
MRFLLDTHVLAWALGERRKLSAAVLDQLADPDNEVFFSAVSIWEIAIKSALLRGGFDLSPRLIADAATTTGFQRLPVTVEHALAIHALPPLHGDPFDRMLVAQSRCDGLYLLTRDAALSGYGDWIQLV